MKTLAGNPVTVLKASDTGLMTNTYVAKHDADTTAQTWYDPEQRLWVCQALDEHGFQDGPADYATSREEAFLVLDSMIASLRRREAQTSHRFANGVRCYDPDPLVWANGEDCLHDNLAVEQH